MPLFTVRGEQNTTRWQGDVSRLIIQNGADLAGVEAVIKEIYDWNMNVLFASVHILTDITICGSTECLSLHHTILLLIKRHILYEENTSELILKVFNCLTKCPFL